MSSSTASNLASFPRWRAVRWSRRENPIAEVNAATQGFIATYRTKAVSCYVELVNATHAALRKVTQGDASKLESMEAFAGANRDLAEFCIGMRE